MAGAVLNVFPSAKNRSISGLDGLRALSILVVMLAHASWYFPSFIGQSFLFRAVVGNGRPGVAVFFVLSGYLITTLLRREFEKTGTVSLKNFYIRRTFRIFPPFYFYLLVLGVLWWMNVVPENAPTFWSAATYTVSIRPHAPDSFFLAHSWSLSIEELFYLFWPLAFVIGHKQGRAKHIAWTLIVLMPILRLSFYFALPVLRGRETFMVQGWIDTMMVGCLLALMQGAPEWEAFRRKYVNGWTAALMALIGFVGITGLQLVLPHRIADFINLAIKPTILAFCIAGVLLYVVNAPESITGRILNNSIVRFAGMLSYSVYIWQQLFVSEELKLLPWGFLYIIGAALFSYWVIELPSLRLRDIVTKRWSTKKSESVVHETAGEAIAETPVSK